MYNLMINYEIKPDIINFQMIAYGIVKDKEFIISKNTKEPKITQEFKQFIKDFIKKLT